MEPTTPSCQPSRPAAESASHATLHVPPTDEALAIAEDWLDTVTQVTCGAWWMTDRDGLVAGARSLAAYTGLHEDALAGAAWLNAIAPADRPAARQRWQAPGSATPAEAAWRFMQPGGRLEWLSVRMQPVAMAPGEEPRWLWVAGQTTQERAVRSIGHFRSLFKQTEQGLILASGQGATIRANAAALRMLGLTAEQAHGKAPLPAGWHIEREDGMRVTAPFQEIASATVSGKAEHTIWQVCDNELSASRWLRVTASPLTGPLLAKRPRALIFLTDVTDRVRQREQIESAAEKTTGELTALRAALDRMTDAFVVLDYAGHFAYLNARAREQFACKDDTALGRPFWEVFPTLSGSQMEAEYRRILRERTPSIIETEIGEGVWYEVRSYPGAEGISVYIRDITDQKRTMAELDAALAREREARALAEDHAQQLDAVFEAVSDGMLVYGPDGSAVRVNQAMRDLLATLGLDVTLPLAASEVSALMRRLEQDGPRDPERPSVSEHSLRRILNGEPLTGEHTVDIVVRAPDDEDLYLNISGAPIRGSDGAILGAVESLRDVTANREAELERSQTLSVVAHELRTPLTAIKLSIDLSLRRARRNLTIDPGTLDLAISSCLQLEHMVNDLVDAARAERKKMELTYEQCDARDLATLAVAEQQATTEKPIAVETPQEPLLVSADRARIRQVLSNLISNAVKYSPPDTTVTLSIELRDGSVWFGVTDEGPGVPPESIPHLFDAFYRAPDVVSLTGPNVGLGLGLFLCKRIVDQHHGQIGMQNRPNGGSLFWFTLPLTKPSPDQPAL
ncbi:MAG TPA: PAS domain S-box protein [Ktedonobacterales bacterium]|nr:PAS domain S-box protein [Ktedonobacterales bacterium]